MTTLCHAGLSFTCSLVRSDISFAASSLATPLLRLVDGETAHKAAIFAAAYGLVPRERRPDPECLQARRSAVVCSFPRLSDPSCLAAPDDGVGPPLL